MTNRKMFFTMLWGAVFRRRSRAMMAVIASLVGAATLFCLASVCVAVPQQMNEEMRAYGANLIVTPASAQRDGRPRRRRRARRESRQPCHHRLPRRRRVCFSVFFRVRKIRFGRIN